MVHRAHMKPRLSRLVCDGVAASAVILVVGCAWAPGYGAYVPHSEEWRREVQTKGKEAIKSQGRTAEALTGSEALVHAELSHHLPPSAAPAGNGPRLTVRKSGGVIFGGGTYVVTATGDFTPKGVAAFVEAAKRLQGHLDPVPRLQLRLFRDTPSGRVSVGDFDLK